jgi:hypothetical protein
MPLPWYNTREDRPIQGMIRGTEGVVHGHTGRNTLRGPREVEEEDDEDAEDEEEAWLR